MSRKTFYCLSRIKLSTQQEIMFFPQDIFESERKLILALLEKIKENETYILTLDEDCIVEFVEWEGLYKITKCIEFDEWFPKLQKLVNLT